MTKAPPSDRHAFPRVVDRTLLPSQPTHYHVHALGAFWAVLWASSRRRVHKMHHETHEEANEPLIAREATDTTELAISEQEADRARTYEPRTTKSSHQSLWLLSLSAGISGLLFGYEYAPSRP